MTAQDSLTWFEVPARELDRAQRFYEALLDIASGSEPARPDAPDVLAREDGRAARAPAPGPAHRPGA